MFRVKIIWPLLVTFFLQGVSEAFGRDDQSKLIEGAKKEGKVVYWHGGLTPEFANAIGEGFKKKHGLLDFEVVLAPTQTATQVAKVSQELKTGKLTVDIICGAFPEFHYQLLRAGELMKYDSPEYKHFYKIEGISSEPGYWVPTNPFSPVMMWNPKYVKKGLVKYTDLLDPKFKGLISSLDARKSESYLMGYFGLRKILGKEFFTRLASQNIFWSNRTPDVANKVVTGEFPVCFMGANRTAYYYPMQGGEIKVSFPIEGVVMLTNIFATLAKAPHPNAAKLLVDYVNSKEVQQLMVEKTGYFSLREDVLIPPKVREFTPPISEIKVIPVDWKSLTEEVMDRARKEFREVFDK